MFCITTNRILLARLLRCQRKTTVLVTHDNTHLAMHQVQDCLPVSASNSISGVLIIGKIELGNNYSVGGNSLEIETWKKLDELFSEFQFMKADAIDKKEILDAEKKLGVVFDPDYRDFIQKYGGAVVGAYPILGLRHAEPMDDSRWSVIEVTEYYRYEGWRGVDDWYIVSIDHADNPVGLNSDGAVYKSDHDFGVVEKIADSFEEYILSCLNA